MAISFFSPYLENDPGISESKTRLIVNFTLEESITLASYKKKHFFQCSSKLLNIFGLEWCAKHGGVFTLLNLILVVLQLYVEIRTNNFFRHISTEITPLIYIFI